MGRRRIFEAGQTGRAWDLESDRATAGPDLVACPVAMAAPAFLGMSASASAYQEVYRLAYERALAESRPSLYQLAQAVFPN